MKSDLVGIRLLKNQKIRSEYNFFPICRICNVVDPHDLDPGLFVSMRIRIQGAKLMRIHADPDPRRF
jgi:hypothetical protein